MKNSKLTKAEMKQMLGGVASIGGVNGAEETLAACSTTCSGSASISVTCKRDEDCKALTDYQVECIHKTTNVKGASKSCPNPPSSTANLIRDAGSITMLSNASSMLAQANAAPQSVLMLLR